MPAKSGFLNERRRIARNLAREAYIEAGGHRGKARTLFRRRAKAIGFDPATILLLLQLAAILWRLWKGREILTPPERPTDEEMAALKGAK